MLNILYSYLENAFIIIFRFEHIEKKIEKIDILILETKKKIILKIYCRTIIKQNISSSQLMKHSMFPYGNTTVLGAIYFHFRF